MRKAKQEEEAAAAAAAKAKQDEAAAGKAKEEKAAAEKEAAARNSKQDSSAEQTANPAAKPWFYVDSAGGSQGPILPPDCKALWGRGEINENTMFFCQGMTEWTAISKIAELLTYVREASPTDNTALAEQWFFVDKAGASAGPKSPAEMKKLFASGDVTVETLCFSQGMTEWTALSKLLELLTYVQPAAPATATSDSLGDLDDFDIDDF
mmetsp:Transcript_17982/g.35151  ORF Transcript_17982/g.35151 Transcript_17982/m.35151 type:complete len:209 (-) Transcript_17982:195-821(-)